MKQTSDLFEISNVVFAAGGVFRLAVAAWFPSVLLCVRGCVYPC